MAIQRCPCHICLILVALSSARGAESSAPPAAQSPFLFIIDYLPPAIYDRDAVTGCFRVENTSGAEAKLDFVFASYNEAGQVLKENTQPVTAAAKGFTSFQGTLDSRLAERITFSLRSGKDVLGTLSLRLLRDETPWPATRINAGRIEWADGGEILLTATTKRVRKQDRAFAPMKWMLGDGGKKDEKQLQASVVFSPGRWWPNEKAGETPTRLGPYELNGTPPILLALDRILSRAPALLKEERGSPLEKSDGPSGKSGAGAPQLVICLPPEDLDAATDPRVYRTVLDALLAHASRMGAKKVIVAPPFHYRATEKTAAALAHEVNAAAAAYDAAAVDPADYLNETLWRVDPDKEGVYGIRPNATGLKKIEQGLFNLIP